MESSVVGSCRTDFDDTQVGLGRQGLTIRMKVGTIMSLIRVIYYV